MLSDLPNSPPKRRIAVFYPAFLGGGAEAVALWILETLSQNYSLTLFTISSPNLERLNALYGTSIQPESIQIRSFFSHQFERFINTLISNSYPIRMTLFHALIRWIKRESIHYDLPISAYNAVDLGKPGIQYIHWVKVLEGNPFFNAISGLTPEGIRQNSSVSNSSIVAACVQQDYQTPAVVVYPPVVLEPQQLPWSDREAAFICSGRLTDAKQPHKVIQILEAVRTKGYSVKLYLTGGGGGVYAYRYEKFIQSLVEQHSSWITLFKDLNYEEYIKLLSRCKYGIHYKKEPFGISIAEMVKAGVIPWVRTEGGQVEIIGSEVPELMFEDEADAIAKILYLLEKPDEQTRLRQLLDQRKTLFSTQRFQHEFTQVVDNFFNTR